MHWEMLSRRMELVQGAQRCSMCPAWPLGSVSCLLQGRTKEYFYCGGHSILPSLGLPESRRQAGRASTMTWVLTLPTPSRVIARA